MEVISAMFSIVIWAVIIIAIIRFAKKNPKNPDKYIKGVPNPQNKPVQPHKPVTHNYGQPVPMLPSEPMLKRCPNCGGEIPVSMMKCDICGKSMLGCGSVAGWAIFAAILGSIVAILNKNGISVVEILKQIVK